MSEPSKADHGGAKDLFPCPFCGGAADVVQYGDRTRSTIYACDECGCRLETGEEFGFGSRWNERPNIAAAEQMAVALERALDFLGGCDPLQTSGGHRNAELRETGGRSLSSWRKATGGAGQ